MLKRILPHLAAVAIFAILTIVFFTPYYDGQTLGAGDTTQWKAMAHEAIEWKEKTGEDALWTNSMFGGMPTFQITVGYPGNWVHHIITALQIPFPEASVILFLMFVGLYILLLAFGVNPWLALGGAMAYGLASFNLISIEAGHNTKVMAMALMAPAIGGMVLAYRGKILLGGALTAFFISLNIDANHFQITFYLLLTMGVLGIYFLVESIIEKKIAEFGKATVVLIAAGILGFLPNVANLWSTWEYGKQTMRGGSSPLAEKKEASTGGGLDIKYASRWSYGQFFYTSYTLRDKSGNVQSFGPDEKDDAQALYDSLNKAKPGEYTFDSQRSWDGEILSLMIPDIKGGGSGNELSDDNPIVQKYSGGRSGDEIKGLKMQIASALYWGHQPFTSGPVYFGAAIVFLFIFGMFVLKSHIKWAALALVFISIGLACGHNFFLFKLFFNTLPLFNKFRTPSMALVIAQIVMPLIGLLALNEVLDGKQSREELTKKLMISGGIALGFVLLFGLLGSFMYSFVGDNDARIGAQNPELVNMLKEQRASMLRMDSLRSLLFIAVVMGLVWAFIQQKLDKGLMLAGIALFLVLDTGMVAKRYLSTGDFVANSQYSQNFEPSNADRQIMQDQSYYRVFDRTVDPYNTAAPAYFHKLIGGYSPAKLQIYQDLIERQLSSGNMKVFDMLNAKYFKMPDQQGREQVGPNPNALGNVWFVQRLMHVNTADEEMNALSSPEFEPRNVAVVHKDFNSVVSDNNLGADSSASIKLDTYSPNKLTYSYNSGTPQVAVFSEIYYAGKHGWKAYLDNKEAPYFRANYVLRAMALPEGKHTVEFRFEPESYYTGNKIAYAGSALLFLFVLGALGFSGYQRMKEIEAEPKPQPKVAAPQTKQVKKK
ncbi:MAG: hypothetical protein U0V74_08375 [Chitinophagales bacterium]